MAYRHEWKHVISPADLLVLRQRLPLLMEWDPHATGGEYLVRSLYFDNAADTILREKLDGVNVREKFRLRYYNGDPTFLRLEKKSKIIGLCLKQTAPLSSAQVQSLLHGETAWMKAGEPLHRELYDGMLHRGLRPKTVVDYTREPFVLSAGHVRVTLDIAFLFWSIAVGIVLAAGLIPLAVVGSVIIGVILLVFVNKKSHLNPYIVVLSCADSAAEQAATELLRGHVPKCVVKSKTAAKGSVELNLEVRLKDENTDFINALSDLSGVNSAVLVSYNGEYMG